MTNKQKAKLKAFIVASFYKYADVRGPDYSEYTGGDLEGFTIEALSKLIDEFDEAKITEN